MIIKRLQLSIHYKTGGTIRQLVHYVKYLDGCIVYALDHPVSAAVQLQIKTSLNNVESFEITQVNCDGWKIKEVYNEFKA